MLPTQLLDFTFDDFDAMTAGHDEVIHESEELAVLTGYWAGYYSGMGRKKPVKTILAQMEKARNGGSGNRAPDVDVDAFLAQERRFKEAQAELKAGGENNSK